MTFCALVPFFCPTRVRHWVWYLSKDWLLCLNWIGGKYNQQKNVGEGREGEDGTYYVWIIFNIGMLILANWLFLLQQVILAIVPTIFSVPSAFNHSLQVNFLLQISWRQWICWCLNHGKTIQVTDRQYNFLISGIQTSKIRLNFMP